MIRVSHKRLRGRQIPCDDCGKTVKKGEMVFDVWDGKVVSVPVKRLCWDCAFETCNVWRSVFEAMDL